VIGTREQPDFSLFLSENLIICNIYFTNSNTYCKIKGKNVRLRDYFNNQHDFEIILSILLSCLKIDIDNFKLANMEYKPRKILNRIEL